MKERHRRRVDVEAVKAAAMGHWPSIFNALAPDLSHAVERLGKKVPCPAGCEGKRSFRLFRQASGGGICSKCGPKPDGFEVLQWQNGWSFIEAVREVDRWLGGIGTGGTPRRRLPTPVIIDKADPEESSRRRNRLRSVWSESVPMTDPAAEPARRYLHNRGLALDRYPATLRFHPRLASYDEDRNFEGYWPAMVALVVDRAGSPVTIHRTYLTREGTKAPVEDEKKLMAYPNERQLSGGAIHLSGTGHVLNVAEGIETALAVGMMTGSSVWATVSAPQMANLRVGHPVKAVWIWADLDRSGAGQEAARILCERLREEGFQASVVTPNVLIPEGKKSVDWLDIYNDWYESVVVDRVSLIRRCQCRIAA